MKACLNRFDLVYGTNPSQDARSLFSGHAGNLIEVGQTLLEYVKLFDADPIDI